MTAGTGRRRDQRISDVQRRRISKVQGSAKQGSPEDGLLY